MSTNKLPAVRRVSLEVYCIAADARDVRESFEEFFRGHDTGLSRPRATRVDKGNAKDARQAAKWHGDWE